MAARNGETDEGADDFAKRRNGWGSGWLRETEKRMRERMAARNGETDEGTDKNKTEEPDNQITEESRNQSG
jgi:hypothetical protein